MALLLKLFRRPVNEEQLQREYTGTDTDADVLVRRLCKIGLKSKHVRLSMSQLARIPLPAIAQCKDGHFILIGKVADDQVLIQHGASGEVDVLPVECFDSLWNCEVVLATKHAPVLGAGGKFDLIWFIPAVLKYKLLLGAVLLMSLFIQIFALVSLFSKWSWTKCWSIKVRAL
ncbi:cysteine peptidase family C39 domain-containing protein [Aeromonas jandaei]|uniref:cysteine peptidase family C39 domain-containing protein n=1 Tax=Aeromonas jandaei TaxID=650 RepID=UPI003BA0F717